MMASRAYFFGALVGAWLGFAALAHAQERRVIQNRLYPINHELTVELGFLPLDVLYKAPTVTGRYTWHFSDALAWEVLSLSYAPTTDVSLFGLGFGPVQFNHFSSQGNELIGNFAKRPFDIDQLRLFAETNLVVTPLYGKFSLFNRANARLEFLGVAGLALANFVSWNPWPVDPLASLPGAPVLPTQPKDFIPQGGQSWLVRPGADAGFGTRLFLGRRVSVRMDSRAYAFFEGYRCYNEFRGCPDASPEQRDSKQNLFPSARQLPNNPLSITPVLYVGLGLSLTLGGPE